MQPWITSLYVDCPPNLVFDATPNETLRCPSKEEVGRYEDAIRRGDIVFQALPFNLQPEAMSPGLFEGALEISRTLCRRYVDCRRFSYQDRHMLSFIPRQCP